MNAVTASNAAMTPIARFSAGEISRPELGKLLGEPISFGDTLAMLHAHNLPLPRYRRVYNPAANVLLAQILKRRKSG